MIEYELLDDWGALPSWLVAPVWEDGEVDHAYSHFLTLQSGVLALGVFTKNVLLPYQDDVDEGVLTPYPDSNGGVVVTLSIPATKLSISAYSPEVASTLTVTVPLGPLDPPLFG